MAFLIMALAAVAVVFGVDISQDAVSVMHQQLAATYFVGGFLGFALGGVILAIDRLPRAEKKKRPKKSGSSTEAQQSPPEG